MNSPATLRVDLQRNRRVIIHAPVNVVQKKNEKPLTRIQKLKIDLAITTLLPYFSRWVEKQEKLLTKKS